MTKYQRNKGRRGEQEAVLKLKQYGISSAHRSLSESGNVEKGDVKAKVDGFDVIISVKIGAQVPTFLYNAIANDEDFAMVKKDRKKWLVVMDFEKFAAYYLFAGEQE